MFVDHLALRIVLDLAVFVAIGEPATSSSGRPSATSLQVKSNSLRPTQSMAGDAFNVSVGRTAACAPTKPILVSGLLLFDRFGDFAIVFQRRRARYE